MAKRKYKIQPIKVASISEVHIHPDVLERIDGYDVLTESSKVGMYEFNKTKVYEVSKLKEIATKSKDNDTNETTRIRMAELWSAVKKYEYLIITK
jgi:hypothetical protein